MALRRLLLTRNWADRLVTLHQLFRVLENRYHGIWRVVTLLRQFYHVEEYGDDIVEVRCGGGNDVFLEYPQTQPLL